MTRLLTRQEIIHNYKIIGSELRKIQEAFFDEEVLQFYKDNKEEHLYLEQFDCLKNQLKNVAVHNKIIRLNHSDINTFTNRLTEKLIELFTLIDVRDFIIISHLKTDFFGNRKNNFKPLTDAYAKLEKIVGNNNYKESFTIDIDNLSDFIKILFWIIRCDPGTAEYIFLFDKKEQLQINLCKYGNIHLAEFNKEQLTEEMLNKLNWQIIQGLEFDNFSTNGKIEGRLTS